MYMTLQHSSKMTQIISLLLSANISELVVLRNFLFNLLTATPQHTMRTHTPEHRSTPDQSHRYGFFPLQLTLRNNLLLTAQKRSGAVNDVSDNTTKTGGTTLRIFAKTTQPHLLLKRIRMESIQTWH